MTSDANSGRAGLWTKPKYPGDAVRILPLRRGDEFGDIRIQQYDQHVRVCAFLPGREVFLPGDTPKVEPERCMYYRFDNQADALFDNYVQDAYAEGWTNDYAKS